MGEQNFNESIQHFCGDSQAAGLFIQSNFNNNNYRTPLNTADRPELLYGTSIENLMFAKNYNKSGNMMNDNDVHNQYIDFIVRTALFHREIDKPETEETKLDVLKNNINMALNQILNRQIKGLGIESKSYDTLGGIKLGQVNILESSTLNDYINTILLLLLNPHVTNNINDLPTVDHFKNFKVKNTPNNFIYFLNKLVIEPIATHISTELKITTEDVVKFNSKLASNIENKLKITTEDVVKFNSILASNIENKLLEYALEMYKATDARSVAAIIHFFKRTVNTPQEEAEYINRQLVGVKSNEKLQKLLTTSIIDSTADAAKNLPFYKKSSNYLTSISKNPYATEVFNEVFLKWDSLNNNARDFYRQQLLVLKSKDGNWDNLFENGQDPDPSIMSDLDRSKIRLNLVKDAKGSSNILFGKTLPFLPVSGNRPVGNVWYTDKNNNVKALEVNSLSKTFLQDLYFHVYTQTKFDIGGIDLVKDLPDLFTNVKSNSNDFSIDNINLIKNFVKSRKIPNAAKSQSTQYSFDDFFSGTDGEHVQDIITRVIYTRENGELYRLDNGTKILYTMDNISEHTCGGSGLYGKEMPDGESCSRYVRECLLSGDANTLGACIGKLQSANMFKVGMDEVSTVDPYVAIQILKTFGVSTIRINDNKYGKIISPQSFDSWKETILPKLKDSLQSAILNDTKLCDYLKGVIAFVQTNPAILNNHLPQDSKLSLVNDPSNDGYLTALNKKLWVNPSPESTEQKLFNSKMIVNALQNQKIAPNSFPTFNNVQNGGMSSWEESVIRKNKRNGTNSQLIRTLMENLYTEMAQGGIPLCNEDKLRINDGINRLAHGEKVLAKYYVNYRILADLILFYTASGCGISPENRELSLNDIANKTDALTYLYQQINEIKSRVNSETEAQNQICEKMANLVGSKLNSDNLQPL